MMPKILFFLVSYLAKAISMVFRVSQLNLKVTRVDARSQPRYPIVKYRSVFPQPTAGAYSPAS